MPKSPSISRALLVAAAASALVLTGVTPAFAASATTTVSTSAGLKAALSAADPGDTIALADGTYTGSFTASASGSASARITLTGSSNVTLTTGSTGSGYGLHVTGDYWTISGISVERAAKGIVLDEADQVILERLDVGATGQEAIHVRASSSNVTVRNNVVHDTGLTTPAYGEGIYVGSAKSNWSSIMGSSSTPDRSDSVRIENNTIRNTSAEGIDIKEGSTGGVVTGNTFDHAGYSGQNYADSWVDVKGNGYTIANNSGSGTRLDAFQVHTPMTGWGNKNTFVNNTVVGGVPGYEVSVQSGATGTAVACDSSGAAKGLTNITCSNSVSAPAPVAPVAPAPAPAPSVDSSGTIALTELSNGDVVARVAAPAGVTVRFKVDGEYLGQDSSAPYSFTLSPDNGEHTLQARWTVGDNTTRVETDFVTN